MEHRNPKQKIRNPKSESGSICNVKFDVVNVPISVPQVGLTIRNRAAENEFLKFNGDLPAAGFEFHEFRIFNVPRFGFVIRIFNARAANQNPGSDLTWILQYIQKGLLLPGQLCSFCGQ